jgi:glycosyltransferase involved in cell wall biosynthesis
MMRIAFVAWHGSEHTRRWAGFYASRGHDVHVVTCGDGTAGPGEAAPPAYVVHDLGPPRLGKVGYLLKAPRARRLIRSLRPDVLHAHHATSYGLLAAAAGVHPLVVTTHGSDVLFGGQRAPTKWALRHVFRSADLVTAPGEHVADAIRALVPTRRVDVFQYGVEVARLQSVAAALQPRAPEPDGHVRLVTARPLLRLYHTDEVIRAVALLRDAGLACDFDIADRGPELDSLQRLAADIGVADRVVFHGYVPERAAEQLLAAADVYVSVAESDGASIALLEAMALGSVPVVSDIAANRLWVEDGVNGVLVDIDPTSIADGVRRALALDRADVRRRNLEVVTARADRERNLTACEARLAELVEARRRRNAG